MQCFCTCVCFHVFLCVSVFFLFSWGPRVCSFSMDLHDPIQNKERKEKRKKKNILQLVQCRCKCKNIMHTVVQAYE